MSIEDWQKCVRHAEGLRDNRIESIIIRLGDDSDNSSDDDDDDLEGVESNAN